MPVSSYFGGNGKEVLSNMQQEYGDKKGESVFYATSNKRKQIPKRMAAGGVVAGIPNWQSLDEPDPEISPLERAALLAKQQQEQQQAQQAGLAPTPQPPQLPPAPQSAPDPSSQPQAEPALDQTDDSVTNDAPGASSTMAPSIIPPAKPAPAPAPVDNKQEIASTAADLGPPMPSSIPGHQDGQPTAIPPRSIPSPVGSIGSGPAQHLSNLATQELGRDTFKTGPDGQLTSTPKGIPIWRQAISAVIPRAAPYLMHPQNKLDQNLATINTQAAAEERQQQAIGTEETRRITAEAARTRAERDAAKTNQLNTSPSRLQWMAINDPDPEKRVQAANTLAELEKHDVRLAGNKAGASTTGRMEATRNLEPYVIKPHSPEFRVAQDLAYGKIDFADLQKLYSYNRDSGLKVALYDMARELNPNFSPKDFEAGFKFASSPKIVAQLSSLDNVVQGVPDLLKFSDLASRTGTPILNQFVNKGGYWIGDKHYSDFNIARIAFADELSGALGYGSATDMSRDMGFNMADPKLSPEAFTSAVQDVVVPFVQRKRSSITNMMGPYANRVPAPEYAPHSTGKPTPASAPPVPTPTPVPAPVTPPPAAAPPPSAQAPQATTIRYSSGNDTFDIPVAKVQAFLKSHPQAKPVQ